MIDLDAARNDLAPDGVLRAGCNLSNFLLVTHRESDGTPVGLSPDMAQAVANHLGVTVEYHCFDQVGLTADAITTGAVAIGLIAWEDERAKTIAFTKPYCEIEATYLVPECSRFQTVEDVDSQGIKIAVPNRAAYDLYLSRTLQNAELIRAQGLPATAQMFVDDKLDALAGLRPALQANAEEFKDTRVLDSRYTTIEQAIGTQPEKQAGVAFLENLVSDLKANGFIADALERHGVAGKLTVAG